MEYKSTKMPLGGRYGNMEILLVDPRILLRIHKTGKYDEIDQFGRIFEMKEANYVIKYIDEHIEYIIERAKKLDEFEKQDDEQRMYEACRWK